MTTLQTNTPRVSAEVIDGEAILIDFVSGAYFSLRDGGAVAWEAIASGATLDDVIAAVAGSAAADPADVAAGVRALVAALIDEHLVTSDGPIEGPAAPDRRLWFTKYTDMEHLLLLDPIHEVDSSGWPVVPPE